MNNKVGGVIITFQYRYRKQIIICSLTAIISLVIIGLVFCYLSNNEEIIEEKSMPMKKVKKETSTKEEQLVSVDIKGEVIAPGIYTMSNNSRVIDVIDKAGGLTENADTTVINLSKKISDEMVIIIYSKEQVKKFEETKKIEQEVQNKCQSPTDNSLHNDACIESNNSITNSKININTATKEELMTLTGIGESKAKDIITYREKNGSFKSIEEIKNVSGIGENVYASIKENITV